MRRKPYTAIGISRVPCFGCGKPSVHQWQICADGNVQRGVCAQCDYGINAAVLGFLRPSGWKAKLRAYAIKLGIK